MRLSRLAALSGLCVFAAAVPSAPRPAEPASIETGTVVRIVDGDTLRVRLSDASDVVTVRLIGIDAPELRNAGAGADATNPADAFAEAATARLAARIRDRRVRLERDPVGDTVDGYGRWLRYVFLADRPAATSLDDSVNAELIRDGYARALTAFRFSRRRAFARLEFEARIAERGLWAEPTVSFDDDDTPATAHLDRTVLVTPTGKKFHRASCRHIGEESAALPVHRARKHYEPCRACRPLDDAP